MPSKTIYGQVESIPDEHGRVKLDRPRVTCLQPVGDQDEEIGKTGTCEACGKELRFRFKANGERLISLACDNKCAREAGYFKNTGLTALAFEASEGPPAKKKSKKKGPCPECGGPPWKRGWKHEEGCTNTAAARAKARNKKVKKDETVSDDSEES